MRLGGLLVSAAVRFGRRLPFLALLLPLALASCREARPVRVVLVTLDTLRYDALVPPPGGESAMPLLLERARGGAIFERFYAATSVTQPSHASMFTALHPWEHGVVSNGQVLEEPHETVAEVLRDAGFATAAVVASYPVAGRFGFAQGFDAFDDRFTAGPAAGARWEGHAVAGEWFYSLAHTVTARALAHVASPGRDPDTGHPRHQFLWVHYFDPHDPYGDTVPGPDLHPTDALKALEAGRDVAHMLPQFRAAYDQDVAYLDRELDRLLAALEADADAFETHVVLASDHGESFGEGGALAHGKRVTDEQVRVPLVILSPRVEPGLRRDVAGSVDVARTLRSLAGVEPPEGAAGNEVPWTRVRDLSAARTGDGPAQGGALGMRRTFQDPDEIELRTDGTRHPLDELLFFAVDPEGRLVRGNGDGLAGDTPPADRRAARHLRTLFRGLGERVEAGGAPTADDPETLRALRALGYVQ